MATPYIGKAYGHLKCIKLATSKLHRNQYVTVGPEFQFATSLQKEQGKKLFPKLNWDDPKLILCTDCETVLEEKVKMHESSEPSDAEVAGVRTKTAKKAKTKSKPRSTKTVHFAEKSAQSQDGESSMETDSSESSGASMEEMRNNSENCQLVPDISSGNDMAISSKSRQVEEASNASSALISNFSRMARKQQARPFGTMEPPPPKSSLFSRGFPAVSPDKSILLGQPRLLLPKYIPSQLADESKNITDSVVEVLIDDDSEMSVDVNPPGNMGPPPPKPAGSSRKRKVASKAISEKAKETAAPPTSQAQKVLNELAALQSEYVRLANRRNRVVKEFEKLKLEEDEMTPEETKGIRNMVKSTLRLDKNTKDNMQELVEFTEEWDKKNNNPLDRVLALQRNSIL